jgi:hypothetical protein
MTKVEVADYDDLRGDQTIGSWVHVTVDPEDLDALVPFVRASYEAALAESRVVPPPDDR